MGTSSGIDGRCRYVAVQLLSISVTGTYLGKVGEEPSVYCGDKEFMKKLIFVPISEERLSGSQD